MAKTATDTTAIKLGGVTEILLTPYSGGKKGETTYSLDNIVSDTTSITQEEPTTNEIECETRDEPLFENTTLGSYSISLESADIQEIILTNCMGFKKDNTNGNLYAPATYKEIWAELEVVFGDKGSLVCPKVKLKSNIDASSLKTGIVRGIIGGTCYSASVMQGDKSTPIVTPFYFKEAGA